MNTPAAVKKVFPNQIHNYTGAQFKSESARVQGNLLEDFQTIMEGNALYLENALCASDNFSILEQFMRDIELEESARGEGNSGMINWSRHYKYDNPEFSGTFQKILKFLGDYFDVEILASRQNFYPDASSWKPFHKDSHAYGAKGMKEDFTMGASFGDERRLAFLHPDSKVQFEFPQRNGDVFAFCSAVNEKFEHGVPRSKNAAQGPRFSIIAWGCRRTINERNGGMPGEMRDNPILLKQPVETVNTDSSYAHTNKPSTNTPGPSILEVKTLVDNFIAEKRKLKAEKDAQSDSKGLTRGGNTAQRGGRLQGGAFRNKQPNKPVYL